MIRSSVMAGAYASCPPGGCQMNCGRTPMSASDSGFGSAITAAIGASSVAFTHLTKHNVIT